MFERFTKDARLAVVNAQEVARDAGSRSIDTRHVVVALLQTDAAMTDAVRTTGTDPDTVLTHVRSDIGGNGLDKDALASLGIDLEEITARAEETFGEGALDRTRKPRGHIPFTKDAKKALELGLREAIRLGDKKIKSRHLLLGIIRADCPGRRALAHDVNLEPLRSHLEQAA